MGVLGAVASIVGSVLSMVMQPSPPSPPHPIPPPPPPPPVPTPPPPPAPPPPPPPPPPNGPPPVPTPVDRSGVIAPETVLDTQASKLRDMKRQQDSASAVGATTITSGSGSKTLLGE